jgi:hypothetical protein
MFRYNLKTQKSRYLKVLSNVYIKIVLLLKYFDSELFIYDCHFRFFSIHNIDINIQSIGLKM